MPASSTALKPEAYCTLFLHASKHPSKAVNGLLLGSADDAAVRVTKVLPLFHSSLALTPMLEAALMLADEHCKASGLKIVGYYQANELCDDLELGPLGAKIAEKIRSQCAQATVLLVDGANMTPAPTDLRLLVLGTDGRRAAGVVPTLEDAEETIRRLEDCLARGVQNDLTDFDAHLDDASKDWLNTKLLSS